MSRHRAGPAILAFALCILISRAAAAQSGQLGWHPTDRGAMQLDGSGLLSFDTYTNRDSTGATTGSPQKEQFGGLAATVQYFVAKGLALGATGSFNLNSFNTEDDSSSGHGHSYELGPSLAWFPGPGGGTLLPYLQIAATWGRTWSRNDYPTSSSDFSGRSSSYAASAGVILLLASYVGADVAVQYADQKTHYDQTYTSTSTIFPNSTYRFQTERSGLQLRLGLAVFVRP